jgi:hypothetical protein
VGLPEDFRKRALQYFGWAQGAQTDQARAAWLSMAEFWHRLAQRSERGEDVSLSDPDPGSPADSSRPSRSTD